MANNDLQTKRQRLVVIGGVAAGMSAASRAKRVNPELDVVVLEKGRFISYGACSLPYFVAGHFDDYRTLIARTPEEAARQGVEVRIGHEAIAIDLQAGTVTVRVHEGAAVAGEPATSGSGGAAMADIVGEQEIPFDTLVLATGTEPIVPPAWDLAEMEGAHFLRSIDDARAIRQRLGAPDLDAQQGGGAADAGSGGPSERAVVIGGGYIGVEAVDALLERGVRVTLVDMAPQLLTNFDADVAGHVEEDLREAGVDLRLGDGVDAIESADGRFTGVRLASGTFIEADMAVVALGVRPKVDLARQAGIRIGETGAIAVDGQQRTSAPNVFAAGDCAEAHHIVTGRPAYIPLGTTANKQGRVAGTVIGGGEEVFPGIVGTAVLKAHNVSVARSGLTEREALALGYDAVSAAITAPDRVHAYPGVQDVHVKLVAEKGTGRLLGAQIAGREPLAVSGRIDVVATALTQGMTVAEFGHLDLSYAPPFAPVWDALLVAANVLQRSV